MTIYSNADSRETIKNLEAGCRNLSDRFAQLKPGALMSSLIMAFDSGKEAGAAKPYPSGLLPNDVVLQDTRNVALNIHEATWFASLAMNSDKPAAIQQESRVARERMSALGQSFGLCSRWAGPNLDAAERRYKDSVWDSQLATLEFLCNVQDIVARARSITVQAMLEDEAALHAPVLGRAA